MENWKNSKTADSWEMLFQRWRDKEENREREKARDWEERDKLRKEGRKKKKRRKFFKS